MTWRCPICGRPTDSAADADFPFCSPRCRLLDLGHWADESYRISESVATTSESESHLTPDDEPSRDS